MFTWLREIARILLYGILIGGTAHLVRLDLDVQRWMSVLYPMMTATSFLVTVVMAIYCARTHITRLMLAAVFYFSAETIVLALLTLTTGTNPVLNIEQYRPLVAWARMFMWLTLLWMVRDGAVLVFREFDSTESRR